MSVLMKIVSHANAKNSPKSLRVSSDTMAVKWLNSTDEEVKECPFSGVTKSGRVWRKVPESEARSGWRILLEGRERLAWPRGPAVQSLPASWTPGASVKWMNKRQALVYDTPESDALIVVAGVC